MTKQYVYLFNEGDASMRNLLGGKGANLAEMTNMGFPVPPGFTISTQACTRYYQDKCLISDEIYDQVFVALSKIEGDTGKKLGDENNPLLVSVRSGARASMPGMMDTILNLGLNDHTVQGLARQTNNERFAYDSYRRFIQMFSDVVMEIDKAAFEEILEKAKQEAKVDFDSDLTANQLKILVNDYKKLYKNQLGSEFPQEPEEQLKEAIQAVFRSWNNARAIYYRRINDIPGNWGTAVNVQSMVFGNMGDSSGTGVAFTRNPSTGEKQIYGEFLANAQGEDVVAGIRTPEPVSVLKERNPQVYKQFLEIAQTLENHYRDMQDMEYTVENSRLYMLQTRSGKRTAAAAIKIATDLVAEKMIDKNEALMRIEPKQLESLLHPTFDTEQLKKYHPIAQGLPASPGAASGQIYFYASDAVKAAQDGQKVILVRNETSPEDIEGMHVAQGILTARGGMTSHAAVVARGMGTCCVAGCSAAVINEDKKRVRFNDMIFNEGDWISLDGSAGNIYSDELPTQAASFSKEFNQIMQWADEVRKLKIRANADSPEDVATSIGFGAQGVGLCRTEHMFFQAERISAMREMIVASNEQEREKALGKILPMQRQDFKAIYKETGDLPVTIRFLDPPLHEFLPQTDQDINALAKEMQMDVDQLRETVNNLHEINPMLGHRGCRLAISYPEIAQMQTRAVIEAAIEAQEEIGKKILPEIMIPLVGDHKELDVVKAIVDETAKTVMKEKGIDIDYKVGTMIEVPRAALTADEIAQSADFFSFGTNDMTQMTFGISRDDAGKVLDDYYKKQIYESDPFARIDQKGVGKLIKMATQLAREYSPDFKLGICGEHGGDPSSIEFCHNLGLDYVSCSPFRVPIARLAAAQAALNEKKK